MSTINPLTGTGPLPVARLPLLPVVPPPPLPLPVAGAGTVGDSRQANGDAQSMLQARDANIDAQMTLTAAGIEGDPTLAFMNALGLQDAVPAEGTRPQEAEDDPLAQAQDLTENGLSFAENGQRAENVLSRVVTGMREGETTNELLHGVILQFPHPPETPPRIWTGAAGAFNMAGGVLGVMGAYNDMQTASQEIANGDLLRGGAHMAAAELTMASSGLTTVQGGYEAAAFVTQLTGEAATGGELVASAGELAATAETLSSVAAPLGAAAGLITGAISVVDGLSKTPPDYGEAAIGGLQGVAGVAMLFGPVGVGIGVAINIGVFAYQHWDQITEVAGNVVQGIENAEQAVENAVSDVANEAGDLLAEGAHFLGF